MAKKRASKLLGFSPSNNQANAYARQLRGIAMEIGRIAMRLTVEGLSEAEILALSVKVRAALTQYSDLIEPWAETAAANMVRGIDAANIRIWRSSSKRIGREIAGGFGSDAVAHAIRERIRENIRLIKGIPRDAGDRIERIVRVGFLEGKRASAVARDLMTTQGFSASRAELIARTEISKASTEITRVRAVRFNSPGYIWRTSNDGAVRDSHADMEGEFIEWGKPPELDGMIGDAGEFPNCRCYPEVVMPAEYGDAEVRESVAIQGGIFHRAFGTLLGVA